MPASTISEDMNEQVYGELCELVYEHSRMFLAPGKRLFLSSRLAKHKRDLQVDDWDSYLDKLIHTTNTHEIEKFIDFVATGHTYFFRERSHFERIQDEFLPAIVQQHSQSTFQLNCWSVAASSGEEAFSLGITLAEYARIHEPFAWQIYATDISRRAINKANACIYRRNALNLPRIDMLPRYFRQGTGQYEGQCKVKDVLIQRVEFFQANVFQRDLPVPERLDLILCRNLLIYFDAPSRQQLISRLEKMLAPGGLLFIGQAESLFNMRHKLQSLGGGVFRRTH